MMISDPAQLAAMQFAFARRDRAADGRFVCAVKTTGIYCRPSCPARRPKPENLVFYNSAEDARLAGFRSCLRCRPDDVTRDEVAVKRAISVIETAEKIIPLAVLATNVGYSPSHFQRIFKRALGLSPAAYARNLRCARAERALGQGMAVTEAIHAAGFSGPSRFYDAMEGRLGMTVSAWLRGGAGVTIRWANMPTYLGTMLLAATDKGVCCLSFGEGERELAARFPKAELVPGGAEFGKLAGQVVAALDNPDLASAIPLDVKGTPFQEAVWRALRKIPAGETRTYAQIAAAAGNPKAVRAAGSANGANPVAVLVPCHRVIRTDGSIGGYAYGEAIKRDLLARESGRG